MSMAEPSPQALDADIPVSAYSRYGDDRWRLAQGVAGHHDSSFVINWTFDLPDAGRSNEPRWSTIMEAMKLFVWSLRNDPLPGRPAVALRTMIVHASRLRIMVKWMAANGLDRWSQLDSERIKHLFADLGRRNGETGMTQSTADSYMSTLRAFYLMRAQLPDAPPVEPPASYHLADWKPSKSLPFTPDAIALPLLERAMRFVEEAAESTIAIKAQAHTCYDEARRGGLTHAGAMSRVKVTLAKRHDPLALFLTGEERPSTLGRLRDAVARLYEGCFIVIAYLVGARASEILMLEPGCVEWIDTEDGEPQAYLVGTIRKNAPGLDGLPHRWVAPEPVVRAIEVLERLSAHWRHMDGRELLWLVRPWSRSTVYLHEGKLVPLSIDCLNNRLNRGFAPTFDLPAYEGGTWHLSSHQGRKTFARFVGRRDRTGLAALSKHLGHVTRRTAARH